MDVRRNMIVRRWGTPQRTVGSLNEAREREEHGVRFNEKWIYSAPRNEPSRPQKRIIYWLRYDFVASFLLERDGQMVREDPRALFGDDTRSRQYLPRDARAGHA